MELQHPLGAISGGVDTKVLDLLARAHEEQMDAAMIARLTGSSYSGVRHAIARLVQHGTVLESTVGTKTYYRFNGQHLLAPAIRSIVDAKSALISQLGELLPQFIRSGAPSFGALFGSAARGDMRPDSDLDLFLAHPADSDLETFAREASAFADRASMLTGNDARVLVYSRAELAEGATRHPVLAEIARDGIPFVGDLAEFRRTVLGGPTDAAR